MTRRPDRRPDITRDPFTCALCGDPAHEHTLPEWLDHHDEATDPGLW